MGTATNLKRLESADAFKSKIKGWIPENCPCRICKASTKRALYRFISVGFNLFIYLFLSGSRIVDVD